MAGCSSGKVGHGSEWAAVAVGTKRTHGRPRVYACPECHHGPAVAAAGNCS
jgi:hypothetical protein